MPNSQPKTNINIRSLLGALSKIVDRISPVNDKKHTDGNNILDTPIVKHYNDLLGRQSSERGKDEVSYFYVEDVFCIHLGTKYANFQEQIFTEIFS